MGIELRNVCFSYGERQVLKGVTFSAGAGELIALLGPNGAGKSTLMRCLLGLLKGYTGSITVDGQDVGALSRAALSAQVAYIPQSAPSTFNYTVLDMVLMGVTGSLGVLGAPKEGHRRRAEETLKSLGVADLARRGFQELSGGERQLVLLARALVQDARVLVMDEPTANLDYGNQNRVLERVAALTGQGYTVLLSTHDPNQALLYATRALTLWDGKILTDAPPAQALTEQVLSQLYRLPVRRCTLPPDAGGLPICVPRREGRAERN
jgi:ABC-type cobalamin/Fe3+-siderophores transport system ATPase subunit